MLTLCLWYLAPTPQCLSVTPKSGNFSWIGGWGQVYLVAAGCREGYGTTSIVTRQPTSVMAGWARSGPAEGRTPEAERQWWADRLGSRRAEWGRLAPQGCFTPLRQDPVGRGFGHGVRRGCREALAGGGSPHLYQRRIVACWHIVTCHHAARGQPSLRDPGLMGLRTGPTLCSHPCPATPAWAGSEGSGGWRTRTRQGGWSTAAPPRRRRRCTGMGYLQPCAGSGRRGRRRGRRPSPWTGPGRSLAERERAAGGRQDRRGLDEDRDGSTLPTPPVLREGHSEPAIDAWGTESKRGWAG